MIRYLLLSSAVLLLPPATLLPENLTVSRATAAEETPTANSSPKREATADNDSSNNEQVAERILLIISPTSQRCTEELQRLQVPGGVFDTLRKQGWTIGPDRNNDIQIVDVSKPVDEELARIVSGRSPRNGPVVVSIENGEIARSFRHGCTTPLDQWTFGWLMTGNDDRPEAYVPEPVEVTTTGNYPLRGNHWSVEGNWNPTVEETIDHLRRIHADQLKPEWEIETWSLEELRSLHDDIHESEEGFRGRFVATGSFQSSRSSGRVFRKPGNARR